MKNQHNCFTKDTDALAKLNQGICKYHSILELPNKQTKQTECMSLIGIESTKKTYLNNPPFHTEKQIGKKSKELLKKSSWSLRKTIGESMSDDLKEPSTILKSRKALCYFYITSVVMVILIMLSMGAFFLAQVMSLV